MSVSILQEKKKLIYTTKTSVHQEREIEEVKIKILNKIVTKY